MSSPSKPTRKTNRSVTKVSYADPEPDENSPSPNIEKKRVRTKKPTTKASKKKKTSNEEEAFIPAAKETAASAAKKLGAWAGWICYKAVGGGRKLSKEEAAKEDAAIDEWLSGKRDDLDKLLVAGNVSKFKEDEK